MQALGAAAGLDPVLERLTAVAVTPGVLSIALGGSRAKGTATSVGRGALTHVAGCVYRALSCVAQVLFALNRRYFVNEKGALEEAAGFPVTVSGLAERASFVWGAIGQRAFGRALAALRAIEQELRAMTTDEQFR